MDLSYTNVECFIKPIFDCLRIMKLHGYLLLNLRSLTALIFTVYGIVHSRSLEYAQIARHVVTKTNHNHTKKRIYRLVNNPDIDMGLVMV